MMNFSPDIVFDVGVFAAIIATGIGYLQRRRRKKRQIRFSAGLEVGNNPWIINYAITHFNHNDIDADELSEDIRRISVDSIEDYRSDLFLLGEEETKWIIRYQNSIKTIKRKLEREESITSADLLSATISEAYIVGNYTEAEEYVNNYRRLLEEGIETESHVFPSEAENMLEYFESDSINERILSIFL